MKTPSRLTAFTTSVGSALLLTAAVTCGAPPSRGPVRAGSDTDSMTPQEREQIEAIKRKLDEVKDESLKYIQALMLFGDQDKRSWERAHPIAAGYIQKCLAVLPEGQKEFFKEQAVLLEQVRRGESSEAVRARRQLYVTGATLNYLRVYETPNPTAWDVARTEILKMDDTATSLLVDSLLQKLMSEATNQHWDLYGLELVKTGRPALEPVTFLAVTLGDHTGPAHRCTPQNAEERCVIKNAKSKIIQCLKVLILCKDWPTPQSKQDVLKDFANSKQIRVREAFAEAVSAIMEKDTDRFLLYGSDAALIDTLLDYMKTLSRDPEADVRMTTAMVLGKMKTEHSGLLLIDILKRETDDYVLFTAIRSLGFLKDATAIPQLISILETKTASNIQAIAMGSLKAITGQDPGKGEPRLWIEWWKKAEKK